MKEKAKVDIDELFREGTPIDEALRQGVKEALARHKKAGSPVVVWQNGKIVWLKPEEFPLD